MPSERTLSIIKPDGVGRNLIGEVLNRFEKAGLKVIAARMMHLSQKEAEAFMRCIASAVLQGLVKFMTSGPVLVQVLEGRGHREEPRVMGRPTPRRRQRHDPCGPREFHRRNVVHGSDAADTAAREIAYFSVKLRSVAYAIAYARVPFEARGILSGR